MPFVDVTAAGDVVAGAVVAVEVDGRRIAVWRTTDGELAACDARCPHQWSDLVDEGRVLGDELVCLAHGWRFDRDGRGTKVNVAGRRDAKADVATVAVRQRAGRIELDAHRGDGGGG